MFKCCIKSTASPRKDSKARSKSRKSNKVSPKPSSSELNLSNPRKRRVDPKTVIQNHFNIVINKVQDIQVQTPADEETNLTNTQDIKNPSQQVSSFQPTVNNMMKQIIETYQIPANMRQNNQSNIDKLLGPKNVVFRIMKRKEYRLNRKNHKGSIDKDEINNLIDELMNMDDQQVVQRLNNINSRKLSSTILDELSEPQQVIQSPQIKSERPVLAKVKSKFQSMDIKRDLTPRFHADIIQTQQLNMNKPLTQMSSPNVLELLSPTLYPQSRDTLTPSTLCQSPNDTIDVKRQPKNQEFQLKMQGLQLPN
ncbi:UNKNOWN [Stylonychia lemnae]|uniref:Uncharacterized protein n=1 Tax=Stylonychia lemnae TaxID=5949 RepID=A0A078AAJ2_STYLE|nr:UNKNOWN [Stylonychia lemnae]|eukprot:CDW79295.1 UNKNOWN [Stylonychia lemnae]